MSPAAAGFYVERTGGLLVFHPIRPRPTQQGGNK